MRKKLLTGVFLLTAMICLTACPGESRYSVSQDNEQNYGDTFTSAENKNVSVDEESMFAESQGNQKLIYTGDVTIGTNSIKKSYSKVTENMKAYKAFFESVDESSDYKTMYIRIPQKNYMKFYESLSEIDGIITSSNINIQDKTKTYTDNAKRMDILQTEYEELKDLMGKANTVEEVLSIRERMSNVTYEIETLKGSNDTIDYDADYGTLTLTLQLNGSRGDVSFWHQVKEAFSDGMYLFGQLILTLIRLWWAIIIVACIVYAAKEQTGPFRKKKMIDITKIKDK